MIRVLTGPPCAGKSTYASENAAAGDVVIDFDKLAAALGNPTPHAAAGPLREVAHAARKAAIDRVVQGVDADSWIIHTWPTAEQLEGYKAAGAEIVELDPGMDEALARAEADHRPDGTAGAIRDWYEKREVKSMPPTTLDRRNKAFIPTTFKAVGQEVDGAALEDGEFIALAAVFGNIDSYGERIQPGAFTETLAQWAEKGDPLPVIWQHDWSDPNAHIGFVLAIEETDEGLLYKGKLDIEENPFAAQVYRLMKGRRVTQQSIGFDIRDAAEAKVDDQWVFDILRVDLHEVGPCLLGVNRATDLIDIKSDGTPREGRHIERSGQEEPPAAEATSASTSSDSDSTSAKSAGFSPASVGLLISEIEMSTPLED